MKHKEGEGSKEFAFKNIHIKIQIKHFKLILLEMFSTLVIRVKFVASVCSHQKIHFSARKLKSTNPK